MKEFNDLLDVADRLLAPDGCPWDNAQTLDSLRPYILEETYELLEAIDLKDSGKICEEAGDCFYALIFLIKIAEKSKNFNIGDVFRIVAEKLIRRHPHIFQGLAVETVDDVRRNWEQIKKKEGKKRPIDGIPIDLPALARAQKILGKTSYVRKAGNGDLSLHSERDLGEKLWSLVAEAERLGLNAESALRQECRRKEEEWSSNDI